MLDIRKMDALVAPADAAAMKASRDQWNAIAKPVGSLGKFEAIVEQIAGLVGSKDVDISKRCVAVLCADNGVVAEGVTQCGQEVTRVVATSVARDVSSVCAMCRPVGIDALAVDMGMASPSADGRVLDRSIARGTGDILREPAMTRAQALQAIQVGIDLVADLKSQGYGIVATGEMGIGNTTTSSAMASVLLGVDAAEVTGKGSGLAENDFHHKIEVIRHAVELRDPDPADPLDVLANLGGFDIAGLVGMFIGGAVHRVPIIMDGFISEVAALTAVRLCPSCRVALLASHLSTEPAARAVMAELELDPVLHAGMHLGEGTGAVCLIPLLDMALSLYHGTTFDESGIDAYDPNL